MTLAETKIETDEPAWKLEWLTPIRCRLILVLVLGLGSFTHYRYLHDNCPIDLSGDESQYWDWSRNPDLSYYSKGPLVAYIIRASCSVFGDTMQAVRYPALILGIGTSLLTYLLTKKLFGSEKLALGTVLMFHVVPMFIAGSVLMTIDPPMFFCWALATYLAAFAVFDNRKWFWALVGVAMGFGFLAKYAAFLWFVGLFGYLIFHDRKKIAAALIAPAVAALFVIPVIIWNVQHNWVSFRHVAKQTGASAGGFEILNVLEMVGTQFGAVGPTIAIFIIGGIVHALRKRNEHSPKLFLLIWIGLAYWALNFFTSFRTKVQANWPAPAYFTLMIVAAWFLSTRLRSKSVWWYWRGWFYATIVIALIAMPLSHDTSLLFPIVRPFVSKTFNMAKVDGISRLRGWAALGQFVSSELAALPPGAFIIGHDYQQTAQMAFYVEGQPKTYCAGPYVGMRYSQYDMWPDRRLDATSPMVGHDAVFVSRLGTIPEELKAAFERIDPVEIYEVKAADVTVRVHGIWRCHNFKGLAVPEGLRDY